LLERAQVDLQRLPHLSPQAYAQTTGFLNHTLRDVHSLRYPIFSAQMGRMFGPGMSPYALACMGGAMQQNPAMNIFAMMEMYQRQQQQFMMMMLAMAATNQFMQQMLACLGQHGTQPGSVRPNGVQPGGPAPGPQPGGPVPGRVQAGGPRPVPGNAGGAPGGPGGVRVPGGPAGPGGKPQPAADLRPGIDYRILPEPKPNPNPPEDEQGKALRAQSQAARDARYAASGQEFLQQYQANFQKWSDACGGKKDLTADDLAQLAKDPKLAYGDGGQALRAAALYLDNQKQRGENDTLSKDGITNTANAATTSLSDNARGANGIGREFRNEQATDAFKQDLQRNFKAWDQKCGSKGYLTEADIDRLMQDPSIKGRDAVALSTMKAMEQDANGEKKELNISPAGIKICDRSKGTGQLENAGTIQWNSLKLGDLVGGPYAHMNEQLNNCSHDLFASPDGMPHPSAVQQGDSGDCYFIASAASLAQQNPQAIKNMIHDNGNGTYTVSFPGRQPITVDKPTDAELAHYGTSGNDGTWLSVLEKGYGAVRQREGTDRRDDTMDGDGIEKYDGADGGLIGFKAMEVLTGHESGDIPIRDASGNFIAPDNIRESIDRTLRGHRLIAAETGKTPEKTDRGQLAPHHEYQILAYDRATDTITIRDPNGNHGRGAAGVPSFAHASGQDDGVMTMRMSDFLRNFNGVSIETPIPLQGSTPYQGPDINRPNARAAA
jgi:hypothetical protein